MNIKRNLNILRDLFDSDRLAEVISTLGGNKSRTFLTSFGIFWGIFMLILLLGGGKGLEKLMMSNFSGFSSNTAVLGPQTTSRAFHGFDKGRSWSLSTQDVVGLSNYMSEIETATPLCTCFGITATYGKETYTPVLKGIQPEYLSIESQKMKYGRNLNEEDMRRMRKVCVLGRKVWQSLFPGGEDPCGKFINVDGIYYEIVGVDVRNSNIGVGGQATESVTVPLPVMQRIYNLGDKVDMIAITGKKGVSMSSLEDRVRSYIYHSHDIAPDDTEAMVYFNVETLYQMFENLFRGINILVWLIGIGTVMSGVVGVTNIMLVSIRERTVELGIRRAIGAKPRDIIAQILAESGIMTITAGLTGLTAAVGILAVAEPLIQQGAETDATFQIPFSMAVTAAAALLILGILAGIFPSLRAIAIKPVEAMRDE